MPTIKQEAVDRWKNIVISMLCFLPLDKTWYEIIDWDDEDGIYSEESDDDQQSGKRRHSVFSLGSDSVDGSASSRGFSSRGSNVLRRSSSALLPGPTPWVLHPGSRFRMLWDVIGATFLLHDVIIIPMQVFEEGTVGWPNSYRNVLKAAEFVACLFWTVDMLLSFLTGFYTRNGYVEMSPGRIASSYLRSWFSLDFTVTMLDWVSIIFVFSFFSDDGGGSMTTGLATHLRSGKIVTRVTRLLRLLRFVKLNKSLIEHFHIINSEYVLAVINLMRLIMILVIFGHYIACGWYGLTLLGPEDRNWLVVGTKHDIESMAYSYLTSLHWSLTQFTPASMEVTPFNEWERAYNIVVILVAMVTFSSFVSSITNTMTHIRRINAERNKEEAAIRRFFSQCNISSELASRVWWVLQQKRQHVDTRLKVSDVPALKLLPVHILNDVLEETHGPVLNNHPLFRCMGEMDPEAMHELCVFGLLERTVPYGELLFHKGEVVTEMFFVVKGMLEYHDLSDVEAPRVTVKDGNWACEAALWTSEAKLAGPFIAETVACDLVMVPAQRVKEIVSQRAHSSALFARYAALFMRRFNKANVAYIAENRLFNDKRVLKQIVHMCRLRTLGSKTFTSLLF